MRTPFRVYGNNDKNKTKSAVIFCFHPKQYYIFPKLLGLNNTAKLSDEDKKNDQPQTVPFQELSFLITFGQFCHAITAY